MMFLGLAPLDWLMLFLYFIVVIFIGFWTARKVRTEEDYFIGGRKFSGPLLIAHWLCTGTHSEMPVQVAGATYDRKVGLGGIWYQWMWLFCTPFYWLIAPITRRMRIVTTGDFFRERYGRDLEIAYTVFAILFYIGFIAMTFQGAGRAIAGATGMQLRLEHTIAILSVVSAFYVFAGGIVAAAFTDFLQGLMIVVLSVLMIPFGLWKIGGMAALHQKLPPEMMRPVAPPDAKEGDLLFIVMMSLIALVGIVAQPHTVVATGSGKTEWEARVGMTYGNFVKRFLTIAWAFTGLIGAVLFVGLEHREEVWGRSVQALLPVGFRGLMVAAMMAGITAVETFMVVGSGLFTRNCYELLMRDKPENHYLLVGRCAAVGMLIGGILIALFAPSVTAILKPSLEIIAFVGIPMWLGIIWRRANRTGAWASILFAIGTWVLGWQMGWDAPHRALLFLPIGFLSGIVFSLLTQPQPRQQLEAFYNKLHTPVSLDEVARPVPAPVSNPHPQKLINHPDIEIPKLSKGDIVGFLVAWGLVGFLIALLWWLTGLGR